MAKLELGVADVVVQCGGLVAIGDDFLVALERFGVIPRLIQPIALVEAAVLGPQIGADHQGPEQREKSCPAPVVQLHRLSACSRSVMARSACSSSDCICWGVTSAGANR